MKKPNKRSPYWTLTFERGESLTDAGLAPVLAGITSLAAANPKNGWLTPRVPDMDHILQVQHFDKCREIVGVGVQVVTVPAARARRHRTPGGALAVYPREGTYHANASARLDYAAAGFDGLISTTRCFIRGWSL